MTLHSDELSVLKWLLVLDALCHNVSQFTCINLCFIGYKLTVTLSEE